MIDRISFTIAALLLVFPVTATAQDASQWAGAYGGLTYSTGTGHRVYDFGPTSFDLEGVGPGIILGYNIATGPWVLGGELAYSAADIGELVDEDYTFTSFLDLKARAGYAMDNVLFYGTVGATFTEWQEDAGFGGHEGNGFLYGVGVDYLVSTNFFIGAEYLVRDVTSDWNNSGGTFDADVNTFTLRVGMTF